MSEGVKEQRSSEKTMVGSSNKPQSELEVHICSPLHMLNCTPTVDDILLNDAVKSF